MSLHNLIWWKHVGFLNLDSPETFLNFRWKKCVAFVSMAAFRFCGGSKLWAWDNRPEANNFSEYSHNSWNSMSLEFNLDFIPQNRRKTGRYIDIFKAQSFSACRWNIQKKTFYFEIQKFEISNHVLVKTFHFICQNFG